MQRPSLTVTKREVLGKKIKKLRKEGILPANIYGHEIKSEAVQLPYKEFEAVFKETGETGLIDIKLDGKTRPVLIHNVQYHNVSRLPLHADFYQVNLKEKVKTMVPVAPVGEPKAVIDKIGVLMQTVSEVEVEALPADLPENIEVHVENLAAIGDQITVGELTKPSGVEILTDGGQVVVKIDDIISEEAKEQAAQEAAAAEEHAAETAEGEAAEDAQEKENAADQAEEKNPARNASQSDAGGEEASEKAE